MEEIVDILQKKLQNKSFSTEEEERFAFWVSSAANQELFEDYKKVWKLTTSKSTRLNPNVDMQWERFKKLREKEAKPEFKIRKLYKTLSAIAAVVVLVLGISVVIQSLTNTNTRYTAELNPIEIHLPDNTLVFLNKNSSLEVSKNFNELTRTVKLNGEALFEVEKNQNIPFIVEMQNDLLVKVLGTKFNLRSFPTFSQHELKVIEGKVLIEDATNNVVVEAGEAVNYNGAEQTFSEIHALDKNLLAWHTRVLEFDNTPINEVALSLERLVNKTIVLPNNISDIRYTGSFSNPSAKEIAEVLALALGWDYKISTKSITFSAKTVEE